MLKLLLSLTCLATLIPFGCAWRIVGGRSANIHKFPYQVSLQNWNSSRHFCGGSIIGDEWILTAAHCTELSSPPYYVRVGSTYHAEGGSIYNVSRIINHPRFNKTTFNNDIALLELERPITVSTRASTIDLPQQDKEIPVNSAVVISGWGDTLDYYEPNDVLRFVTLHTMNPDDCYEIYKKRIEITNEMICATHPGGGKDACQGDSGGPLAYNKDLYGIVSFGDGCGDEKSPGVYTRVSSYRDWIHQHTGL